MRARNYRKAPQSILLLFILAIFAATTGCALLPRAGTGDAPGEEAIAAAAPEAGEAQAEATEEPARPRWRLFGFGGSPAVEPTATPETAVEAQPAAEEPATSSTTPYRLRPGDALRIVVGSIPREQASDNIVDERGTITLDYIGRIKAEGLTSSELEEQVQKAYVDGQIYRSPTVKVMIASRNYYVRGEVRRPGSYPLTGVVTLSQAIAAAGGYTEFANPRRVALTRGAINRNINMRDVERSPEQDEVLEAGDVIVVGRGIW